MLPRMLRRWHFCSGQLHVAYQVHGRKDWNYRYEYSQKKIQTNPTNIASATVSQVTLRCSRTCQQWLWSTLTRPNAAVKLFARYSSCTSPLAKFCLLAPFFTCTYLFQCSILSRLFVHSLLNASKSTTYRSNPTNNHKWADSRSFTSIFVIYRDHSSSVRVFLLIQETRKLPSWPCQVARSIFQIEGLRIMETSPSCTWAPLIEFSSHGLANGWKAAINKK